VQSQQLVYEGQHGIPNLGARDGQHDSTRIDERVVRRTVGARRWALLRGVLD
jgi:hypothetical protein